jgi:hypothetical protein
MTRDVSCPTADYGHDRRITTSWAGLATANANLMEISFARHQFPPDIIRHAVVICWLYPQLPRCRRFARRTRAGRHALSPYWARSAFLSNLPTLALANASTNRIFCGTMSASGRSPQRRSLTPITAHSATPTLRAIRSSSWSDETHSPPVLMTSLMRSTTCRSPPGGQRATADLSALRRRQ